MPFTASPSVISRACSCHQGRPRRYAKFRHSGAFRPPAAGQHATSSASIPSRPSSRRHPSGPCPRMARSVIQVSYRPPPQIIRPSDRRGRFSGQRRRTASRNAHPRNLHRSIRAAVRLPRHRSRPAGRRQRSCRRSPRHGRAAGWRRRHRSLFIRPKSRCNIWFGASRWPMPKMIGRFGMPCGRRHRRRRHPRPARSCGPILIWLVDITPRAPFW